MTVGTVDACTRGLLRHLHQGSRASTSRCWKRSARRGARTPPADASHDFMRAAHTLASSSRTAGFAPLADLAGALEHWTGFAARRPRDPKDGETVQAAVASLRGMVESIRSGEAPALAAARRRRALRALIARLRGRAPRRRSTAARAGARPPDGREKRVMRDDIDAQLLPIFLEEARAARAADRRRPARLEGEPGRREDLAVAAPRAAHPEGQRAHGGRDPPGRALPPDGKPHRGGARGGRSTPPELFDELEEQDGPPERRRRAPALARGHARRRRRSAGAAATAPATRRSARGAGAARRAAAAEPGGDAARQRRHARPPDQRGGRGGDRALARRGRAARRSSSRSPTSPTASRACAASCARSRCRPTARCSRACR